MKYWFKRRRYGYGWIPASWQGWLVLVLYVVAIMLIPFLVDPKSAGGTQTVLALAVIALATVMLIRIILLTAPRPKWRWGRRDDDNPDEDF